MVEKGKESMTKNQKDEQRISQGDGKTTQNKPEKSERY